MLRLIISFRRTSAFLDSRILKVSNIRLLNSSFSMPSEIGFSFVELIQEFGAVLRDFIPVILVDKTSVAETDSLLPLTRTSSCSSVSWIGPVELGSQYLRYREVPALLLKLQLQDL